MNIFDKFVILTIYLFCLCRGEEVLYAAAFRKRYLIEEGNAKVFSTYPMKIIFPRILCPALLSLSPALAAVCVALPPVTQAVCCTGGGED